MLYIKPKSIVTPEGTLGGGAVLVADGRILQVGSAEELPCPPGAERFDAADLLLVPGLIDLQINGAFGHDFTADPSSIWEVGAKLPMYGVTAFLPTVITSPLETIAHAQEVICQGPPDGYLGAMPIGLHLEGPFLNPAKRGAHNPVYLCPPDIGAATRWSPAEGVRLVTLAPELPGALSLISELSGRGVAVSAGHSMATFDEAHSGIEAGIRYGTHLFNSMPPLDHREPGLVGALLGDERVTVGLIPDGIHLHPSVVKLAWLAKGQTRISLVTDAMAALGMPPGVYRLADQDVFVDERSARLADGRLAGSVLSLDQALRNLIEFTGCSLADALATVTTVPAELLRLGNTYGRIAPGYRADMTLLTPDLQVAATLVGGEVVFQSSR